MAERIDRARPLSRDQRRQVIIDATIPLLVAHGRAVTTRQIAEAAGVAEGTIYSVFDDKDELVSASVHHHLDTATMAGEIAVIDAGLPLPMLIEAIVELTRKRVSEVFALLAALGFRPGPDGRQAHRAPPDNGPILDAIADLLVHHRAELRVPPRRAAEFIRLAAFAMTHPLLTGGHPVPADEVADLLLNGFGVPAPRTDGIRGPARALLPEENLA